MNLNDVHRGIHKHRKRKRLGRGPGSGHGKTSGRGHKGQWSRSGVSMHPAFEGGQMPLVRRIPKRGFHNRWARQVTVVNVGDLEDLFEEGAEVTPETLAATAFGKCRGDELKVLGDGEISKRLRVAAHRFSRAAREKIEKAGGEVVVLAGKTPAAQKAQAAKQTPEATS